MSAGAVRIRVRNVGLEPHELVLVRTGRFADALPIADDRARVRAIGPTLVVAPGQTASALFPVRAGLVRPAGQPPVALLARHLGRLRGR